MKNNKTELFIKKAIKKHGDKYGYSKVDYKNPFIKIKIICLIHGVFLQAPTKHLSGQGCKKCGIINLSKIQASNTKEFIKKAKKVHGNLYNYSKVNYVNCKTKVVITCKKHGKFLQTPNGHFRNGGCNKCAQDASNESKMSNIKEFLKKAKKVHGNLYNYSKVIYERSSKPVIIICKKHGEFKQSPNAHLANKGCFMCKESTGERKIARFLNDNKINHIREAKFSECRHKVQLKFDFYLLNYNCCIEYDGRQHFDKSTFYSHKLIPIRDAIKTRFCRDNSINLIRISYKDFNKIEQILTESLKINNKIINI
jgi:hypothetical protein